MEATHGEVKRFHRRLLQGLARLMPCAPKIADDERKWRRAAVGTEVAFELGAAHQGHQSWTECGRGARWAVVACEFDTGILWASWQERWRPQHDGQFRLIDASWCFFWGMNLPKKTQLFRAEWMDCANERSLAAQPHWHFDREQLADVSGPSRPAASWMVARELQEVTAGGPRPAGGRATGIQVLDFAGVHFGMSGWRNRPPDGLNDGHRVRCWQSLPADLADLEEWAVRCLELVIDQIDSLVGESFIDSETPLETLD